MTPGEIRAARGLLKWSREYLAERAVVSLSAVIRLENGTVETRPATVAKVRGALEKAGIEFLSLSGAGEGIRVRSRRLR
jgi:predicted transcriptional regulator